MIYSIHPACALYPDMLEGEFYELLTSMQTHGFDSRFPVIVHGGMILDGRHREKAARAAGVEAVYHEWSPETEGDDPASFIARANCRRSLTPSQRAMVAQKLAAMLKGDKAVERAAKVVGVSPRAVYQAQAVQKASPEIAEQVRAGKTTVSAAARKVKSPPPPPPDEDQVIEDQTGRVVPESLEQLFCDGRLSHLCTKLTQAESDAKDLAVQKIGVRLNLQAIHAEILSAKRLVANAAPFAVCPYPHVPNQKCKACDDHGWLTELAWKAVPTEIKGAAK